MVVQKSVMKLAHTERALGAAKANRIKLRNMKAAGRLRARHLKELKKAESRVFKLEHSLNNASATLNELSLEA